MKILATTCAAIAALALTAGVAQSSAYCEQQANAAANQVAKPAAGGLVGGALGGLAGLGLGSALGQGSEAKVLGGIAGGVAGAAVGTNAQRKKREQVWRDAYEYCMSQGSPAAYVPAPPAGSQQWVYSCSIKYKSFIADPNSPFFGTYQPFANPNGSYPPRQPCQLP
jgi:predicted lipid-binding transport protein (Tim44 family)